MEGKVTILLSFVERAISFISKYHIMHILSISKISNRLGYAHIFFINSLKPDVPFMGHRQIE